MGLSALWCALHNAQSHDSLVTDVMLLAGRASRSTESGGFRRTDQPPLRVGAQERGPDAEGVLAAHAGDRAAQGGGGAPAAHGAAAQRHDAPAAAAAIPSTRAGCLRPTKCEVSASTCASPPNALRVLRSCPCYDVAVGGLLTLVAACSQMGQQPQRYMINGSVFSSAAPSARNSPPLQPMRPMSGMVRYSPTPKPRMRALPSPIC
eukprot:683142-Rhodomonas_salina.19